MTAPGTAEHSDSETVTAVVSAAARAAAALVPAHTELVPGAPVSDPDTVPLPPGAASAVAAARRAGERRPLELFVAGARGFLRGSWEGRALGGLFVDKDGPPGFELMRRTRGHEWLRQNSTLLRTQDDAIGRVTVAVLTTIIGEAGREVMASRSRREAEKITDAAVAMIERLGVLSDGGLPADDEAAAAR